MNYKIILLLFLVFSLGSRMSQAQNNLSLSSEKKFVNAFNYIKSTVSETDFKRLDKNCIQYDKNRPEFRFVIWPNYIDDKGCDLCDLLQKRYGIEKDCREIIMKNISLLKTVKDSIYSANKERRLQAFSLNEFENIKKYISKIENNYTIYFSSLYKNTLYAELDIRCTSSPRKMGKVKNFYFIFNSQNEIEEVFEGYISYL